MEFNNELNAGEQMLQYFHLPFVLFILVKNDAHGGITG